MPPGAPEPGHAIEVHLDRLLAERGMTLTELADRVGITIANLSILKNGRAKAVRFTTLTRLCEVLECQPADLLTFDPCRSGVAVERPSPFATPRAAPSLPPTPPP